MKKRTILLVLALLIGSVRQAAACKCARKPEAPPEGSEAAIAADLAGSASVFTGKVIRMQSRVRLYLRLSRYWFLTRGDRELSEEEEERLFLRRIRLSVDESFKGGEARKVVLYTGWGGGDCGYAFRRGAHYLVYANEHDDELYTGTCHSTKPLEEAEVEIAILRQIAATSAERRSAARTAPPAHTSTNAPRGPAAPPS